MGAAWAQTGKIIPLLADSLRYDDLNHTPLQGLQMLCDHSTEDLTVLFEELRTIGIATNERLVEFNRQLTKYLHSRPSKQLLQPDSTGFYTAKIKEIRRTPPAYRCYKIDGLLQLNEPFSQEETHWIFYKAGMYEDLQEEDIIRFSIDSIRAARLCRSEKTPQYLSKNAGQAHNLSAAASRQPSRPSLFPIDIYS